MKFNKFYIIMLLLMPVVASAQMKLPSISLSIGKSLKNKSEDFKVVNESYFIDGPVEDTTVTDFKPSITMGALMHTFFELSQSRTAAGAPNEGDWNRGFVLYRARLLAGVSLSKKGSFFMETEIPSPIGGGNGVFPKNVKVSPIILDFQYEHVFSNQFSVIAGKQLVSNNRNGLQGAASLMANDFTHYQYPYNLFETDPLQGNFGRDLGVNTRGFFLKDRLEYRLGVFTGRRFSGKSPMRVVGRLAYNLLNVEKDFYYAGTKLGTSKTLAIGTGVDAQGDYFNLNVDAFLDVPVGDKGAITANAAFAYIDGGDSTGGNTFSYLIPKQTVQFLELGYYFKPLKLQPWIKFENQNVMEARGYYRLPAGAPQESVDNANQLNSNVRLGGGLNYWFNQYNTNLRLSYTQAYYWRPEAALTGVEKASTGQLWLQLQVFFF